MPTTRGEKIAIAVSLFTIAGISIAAAKTQKKSIAAAQAATKVTPDANPVQPNAPESNEYTGEYTSKPEKVYGPKLIKQGPTRKLDHPFYKHFSDESEAIAAGYKNGDQYKTPDGSIWEVASL